MRAFYWYQNHRPWITLNGRYALDCRIDASFGAQYKNFNEDRPIVSAVRWATNRSEAAKIDNLFYRMQRQFSDILNSNDTKTGDFERHENFIGHVHGRTSYVVLVVLSELTV